MKPLILKADEKKKVASRIQDSPKVKNSIPSTQVYKVNERIICPNCKYHFRIDIAQQQRQVIQNYLDSNISDTLREINLKKMTKNSQDVKNRLSKSHMNSVIQKTQIEDIYERMSNESLERLHKLNNLNQFFTSKDLTPVKTIERKKFLDDSPIQKVREKEKSLLGYPNFNYNKQQMIKNEQTKLNLAYVVDWTKIASKTIKLPAYLKMIIKNEASHSQILQFPE